MLGLDLVGPVEKQRLNVFQSLLFNCHSHPMSRKAWRVYDLMKDPFAPMGWVGMGGREASFERVSDDY